MKEMTKSDLIKLCDKLQKRLGGDTKVELSYFNAGDTATIYITNSNVNPTHYYFEDSFKDFERSLKLYGFMPDPNGAESDRHGFYIYYDKK